MNTVDTIVENRLKKLNNVTEEVEPIVESRWSLLNNVNYYMDVRNFWKQYLFVYIFAAMMMLLFVNNWDTFWYVTVGFAVVFVCLWLTNILVAKVNTTKHIPEIIKEKFDINQNTPIYIDKYNCVCQAPSEDNPFMNVLLSDIEDNPFRPKAADPSDPVIEQKINDYFYSNPAFINPRDIYQTHNDQHQWYTLPATTIPADRQGWMDDAYRDMTSCKDNQFACVDQLWDLRRP